MAGLFFKKTTDDTTQVSPMSRLIKWRRRRRAFGVSCSYASRCASGAGGC
jgi:hypothetical protein